MIGVKSIAHQTGVVLFFILCISLSSCFETVTKARRLEKGRHDINLGISPFYSDDGRIFDSENSLDNSHYGAFYIGYEYDFTDNIGLSLFLNAIEHDPEKAYFGSQIIVDFMPKEWFFHVLCSPGILLYGMDGVFIENKNNDSNTTTTTYYGDPGIICPAGNIAFNIGPQWFQFYTAFSYFRVMKWETGFYLTLLDRLCVQLAFLKYFGAAENPHAYALNFSVGWDFRI